MIKEFAVDPAALARWDDCRFITSLFSAGNGRVIANFPKKWKRMAFEEAKKVAKDVELSRIIERLDRLDKTMLLSRGRPGGENERWLDNAMDEHARFPFSSIISSVTNGDVISVDDIDENQEPFLVSIGFPVERNAQSMADAISVLFQSGRHFKFIDPYFTPTPRYIDPFRQFIEQISNRDIDSSDVVVEVVVKTEGDDAADKRFIHNFTVAVNGFFPDSMELRISFSPENLMHDRWVLSDWAGVSFGHGLGEGDEPATVNVTLLDEPTRKRHWEEFSET